MGISKAKNPLQVRVEIFLTNHAALKYLGGNVLTGRYHVKLLLPMSMSTIQVGNPGVVVCSEITKWEKNVFSSTADNSNCLSAGSYPAEFPSVC